MPSLLIAARSRLRSRTFFPLSKMTGFIPLSNKVSAANNPAGPEPMIATRAAFFTFGYWGMLNSGNLISSPIYAIIFN